VVSIPVKIINDTIPEDIERFRIRIVENDSIKLVQSWDDIFYAEIIDDDLVTYYFVETEGTGRESAANVSVKVKISKPLEKSLELNYTAAIKSTATIVKDFTFADSVQKLMFTPGVTEALIPLKIINDYYPEKEEFIILKLSSESDFAKPRDTTGYHYTITDNDTAAQYSFQYESANGLENDTVASAMIRLSRIADTTIVLNLTLDNNPLNTTATQGTDFTFIDNIGSIVFEKGETLKRIKMGIVNDTIPESDEKITLKLGSNSEFTVPGTPTTFIYTIKTDEVSVNFLGSSTSPNEWPVQTPYDISIELGNTLTEELIVYYTADTTGSATLGADFSFYDACQCLTFRPGEKTKKFRYRIINDCDVEPSEHTTFKIIGVSNNKIAYIGNNSTIAVEIGDNDSPSRCQ
jgi:hypothetical protein